jgi:hypothetical protein
MGEQVSFLIGEKMYRILTEDVNRDSIKAILARHVMGATLTYGSGMYKGEWEDSLAIYLVNVGLEIVETIAQEIKVANKQESILILHFHVDTLFI